ncbi:helix-turn-helix domain-containing protein [Bifidobacterium aquikefiricola]|uniref:Helix-turn-helix domain-containing protein n=1 Tax=Bifidobacterium aquikefiricola TaxID=3059038 RepID=A0AB39U7J1_9BIFI
MGRSRGFDDGEVLGRVRTVFLERGFEGASIDDLVRATGLLRGSLYGAFGSKRGMFVAALRDATSSKSQDSDVLNLVLVALMELSNRDSEVRGLVKEYLECLLSLEAGDGDAGTASIASLLGRTLLKRGNVRLNVDGGGR